MESRERLGRHRGVVEQTLAWLNRFRRLRIRSEQRDDLQQAVVPRICARLCGNQLHRTV